MVLDQIQKENDIKKLSDEELEELRVELREFLIQNIAKTGGHLASNLGVVELTMALHLTFTLPQDKIIWDVGHQSYTHKILTGRKEAFATLRQFGGISGFPKGSESASDSFDTGHSSTSISAGLGLAKAREITGEDYSVVSVIGDGALTGGMAFEGLNNASDMKTNFIIVLNDNNMSISENVGGMNRYLSNFRTADAYMDLKLNVMNSLNRIPVYGERMVKRIRNAKSGIKQLLVPGMYFEEMGIIYLGPVDGSDIKAMCKAFSEAKRVRGPVLVHVITKKGDGYLPAEQHPARFHGTEPFDIKTGEPLIRRTKPNYTDVFSAVMKKLGEREPQLVAITAAMADGTGLTRFARLYPNRFFDVGIAEGHGVTFAAGLAKAGLVPVVAAYSSFLQRAYDQILHDVCQQKLHVVFAVDRAGLVGSDGATHQGIFDLSYLTSIPGLTVMAPKNRWELSDMLRFAIRFDGPIAVRYPRGEAYDGLREFRAPIETGRSEVLYEESQIALFALGSMVSIAEKVRAVLKEQGYSVTLVNARFAAPLDASCIRRLADTHELIVTMEENVASGGLGEHVAAIVCREKLPVQLLAVSVPDQFVEHGSVGELYEMLGLDAASVAERIKCACEEQEQPKN
ncbi:MAG: 1-deoxy-D-xylulose-5-phosphate synthase [Lachnospiraceae bacterium]|nr:1-deoxy-D-xylulose-5-phosphate synthase [Lachnospiraceae bacterium]MDY5521818.1 1-deoxy-D-xylulose-5-phosphate synthase [Agathobacter sp.]